MELDDLKYKLKQQLDSEQQSLSTEAIAALLQKKAKTQLDKIRHSLLFEMAFTACFIIACIILAFTNASWYIRIYFLTFGILSIAMVAILYYLWKKINALTSETLSIKKNLETLIHILQSFTKRYLQFTMLLLPACAMYALMLLYVERRKEGIGLSILDEPVKLLIFIACLVGLMIPVYFSSKYYIRKLYGRHIAQLEESMKELQGEI